MRIRIRTADTRWSTANGQPAADGMTVITVPDGAVQALTFAGVAMLRFDLRTVSPRIPSDWPSPWAQVPAAHAVTN